MFGFGEHLGLTTADNEEGDFRFFFAAHVAEFKSCQVMSGFVYYCFHGFEQREGDIGFRLLFWVRDCGSIAEELLGNSCARFGDCDATEGRGSRSEGAERFDLDFDGSRRDWGKFKIAAD